jgi:hypothetical protein
MVSLSVRMLKPFDCLTVIHVELIFTVKLPKCVFSTAFFELLNY